MKYFVYSPWWKSGGPEALHQLCSSINDLGGDAFMIYENGSTSVYPEYSHYNVKSASGFQDDSQNVLIIPECIDVNSLADTIKSTVVYWWLSLDTRWDISNPRFQRVYHGCQSYYVMDHIRDVISDKMILSLSDYTKQSFVVDESVLVEKNHHRENIVLFNPLKGYDITQRLEKEFDGTDVRFIPIKDMTADQIRELSYRAKVYIDFGGHPGKDRIPREMALSGCSIIVGKRGSAFNAIDVPINRKFDYDVETNSVDFLLVKNRIENDIRNFDRAFEELFEYRHRIRQEKEIFYKEVVEMMKRIQSEI